MSLAQAEETLRDRPALDRERHAIGRELHQDLHSRVFGIAADPPDSVLDRLGPRPERDVAAGLWDEAAARIDQHRTAFDVTDQDAVLGSPCPVWERSAFATSQLEASRACEQLDRSIGRAPEIEPHVLELGIELW